MSNFKVKEGTHIVIKIEDLQKYTSEVGRRGLQSVLSSINSGRLSEGKSISEYLVVKTTEPYEKEIRKVIREGEEAKEICKLLSDHFEGERVIYWKDSNTFGTERYLLITPENGIYVNDLSEETIKLIQEFYKNTGVEIALRPKVMTAEQTRQELLRLFPTEEALNNYYAENRSFHVLVMKILEEKDFTYSEFKQWLYGVER